ncbi:MAG: hypothetical protein CVU56_22175 [Deltaproteobacteria bacterium HGW-Deltaproteobacteria-14]|nr:MAG: hypothetical protein CVU56_22175 [Deltaproteobacteria bacterium HGW-Deltaproteobacteria-14]
MNPREPKAGAISRRTFIATSAAGVAAALGACGSDGGGGPDGVPFDGTIFDTVAADTAVVIDSVADTAADTAVADTAVADTADPPVDTEPEDSSPIDTFDASDYVEDPVLFPLGVQSGDPLPDGAVLWTRFTGEGDVEVFVFRNTAEGPPGAGPLSQREKVTPGAAGFVHADLGGVLDPWTEYHYCFVDGTRRSRVARFRTAPAAAASPVVVFGAGSCSKYLYRPFEVLSRASEADLDLFLLLGDTVYADGADDAEDYREKWAENFGTDGYRDLFRTTPCVATWDDHEVANNWDPETGDAALIATARAAFFEHLAIRRAPDAPERIWRSVRYGRTLEVFVLDCRGEKRPSTRKTEAAEYISVAQMTWLKAALTASPATFKVIMNSVPITNMPIYWLNADERWEGYDAQRDEILAHTAGIPGVLWVSGDFHYGSVQHVDKPGDPFFAQIEVLTGPLAQINPATGLLQATGDPAQFEWITDSFNYTRFTADPAAAPPAITVDHVGPDGTVLHTRTLTF